MGKKVKKIVKKVFKGTIGGGVLGSVSSLLGGSDNDMKSEFAAQEAERRRAEEASLQAQRDAAADLRNREVAEVNIGAGAGGTADQMLKRKKQGSSLSDSLGLRI